MKPTSGICAAAAVVFLAGCASYETPAPAVAVATPDGPAIVATTAVPGSSVYYDQFYGPVYSGYWGSDGMFHYELASNGPWLIDSAHHFRHDASTGFTVVTITPIAVPPG